MVSRVVPPPPSEETESIRGAGVSELSGPLQSTILPFEYVCRTWKTYVLLESRLAFKRKTASSPVGTFPPLQVTFWTTFSSPEPVACSERFQPGSGSNESIAKPFGTVSSTCVVVAFASSVGTASVNCWRTFALATGGLRIACADALPASTSETAAAMAITTARFIRSPFA